MITKVTLLQVFFGQYVSRENAPDIEIWSIHKELVQVLYCYSEFRLAYLQTFSVCKFGVFKVATYIRFLRQFILKKSTQMFFQTLFAQAAECIVM